MVFTQNFKAIAKTAMSEIDPSLTDGFVALIVFLSENPEYASNLKGKTPAPLGSEAYIKAVAKNFSGGRLPKKPARPETIPDEMVSFVLEHYFELPAKSLDRIVREHGLSMGAENIIGDLLERYLASVLEPRGWIWCSGSLVKAVDFVLPPKRSGAWRQLQVKNRDNSENSSSSAIRKGTDIEKWHRTFSKKTGSNWAAFPDEAAKSLLSEEGFRAFVKRYLQELKAG